MKGQKQGPGLVVLTGAGISAESGIKTFRDAGGLWEGHRMEDVATPEGFARNPGLVQDFYNRRRRQLAGVEPNAAHLALAALERAWPGPFLLVTQNVDDLHGRAGSRAPLHMHGELLKARCMACGGVTPWDGDILPDSPCPTCRAVGRLRPHIVWFGERPLGMGTVYGALEKCAVFAAIGTSGQVYPAAGFVGCVGPDCLTVELNLEPGPANGAFGERRLGPATETVPVWVDGLVKAYG